MSQFKATVTAIDSNDSINIVTFKTKAFKFSMMSLTLDENVQVGVEVMLGVKASSVAIAKEFTGALSYSNQLPLEIVKIDSSKLLCSLELASDGFTLESIITTNSKNRMQLKEQERVTALIKSSDLYIAEIL